MFTPLFTLAGAFGGEIGTVARRCWALCGSRHGFHVLVASMFEMLERDFVQEGANYMEFNQALGRCETKMRSALTSAASCGSHVEVPNLRARRPASLLVPLRPRGRTLCPREPLRASPPPQDRVIIQA